MTVSYARTYEEAPEPHGTHVVKVLSVQRQAGKMALSTLLAHIAPCPIFVQSAPAVTETRILLIN